MIELLDLRTRNTKTFSLGRDEAGRDRRRMVVSRVPLHYGTKMQEVRPCWVFDGCWRLTGVPFSLEVGDGVSFAMTCEQGAVRGRLLLETAAVPVENRGCLWWLGVRPDMDAVLVPVGEACALHVILHSPRAPRVFEVEYMLEGDMAVGHDNSVGRDNIDDLVQRHDADMWRELEILFDRTREGDRALTRTEWTGRVKQVDRETRKKSWTRDVAYPVRIR